MKSKQSKQVKETKQLKVSLDELRNPNQAIVDIYKKTKAEDWLGPWRDRPDWNNEDKFFRIQKASKKPIKNKIISLYKIRENNLEYVWGYLQSYSQDLLQNPIESGCRTIGKYELPDIVVRQSINPEYNPEDGTEAGMMMTNPPDVLGVNTVYQWEFSKMRDQLESWYKQNIVTDRTNFYAVQGNRTYTCNDFEEWLDYSIQDLVIVNRSGIIPEKGLFSSKEILELAREKVREDVKKILKTEDRSPRSTHNFPRV